MKSNLPEGWALTTLGTICQKAESISPNLNTTFLYIDIASIDNSIYRVTDAKEYSGKDAPSRARQLVYTADTLISTVRPYLRKIAFVTQELDEQIASTGFTVVRAREGIDSKYVFYNAISDGFINSLCEKQRGASYPAVRDLDVFEQQIRLPPLVEQRRIVAKLDATMQRVEASQARLAKLPGLLKQFRQAVLAAAVSGRLTEAWRAEQPAQETGADLLARIQAERRAQWEAKQRAKLSGKQLSLNDDWKQRYEEPAEPDTSELPELPEGWVYVSVEQTASVLGGKRLPAGHDYTEEKTQHPYLRVKDFENGSINQMDLKYLSPETAKHISRYTVNQNDVFISIAGSIGITGIIPPNLSGANLTENAAKITGFTGILPQYIHFFLSSSVGTRQIVDSTVATSQPKLALFRIEKLIITLPPLVEQQEIVRQVNHYFALADALETRYEQAAAMVEHLPQALLAKAFSGQLVPQDPSDEPAGALLERLRNAPVTAKVKRQSRPQATDTIGTKQTRQKMKDKPVKNLPEFVERLIDLGGKAEPKQLLIEFGLQDDVDSFFELLRDGKSQGLLSVPTGQDGLITLA